MNSLVNSLRNTGNQKPIINNHVLGLEIYLRFNNVNYKKKKKLKKTFV